MNNEIKEKIQKISNLNSETENKLNNQNKEIETNSKKILIY